MATRVYNLDSETLNNSLADELSNQISQLIKQLDCQKFHIDQYKPELLLLTKLYLWHKTVYENHSSVGHNLFGLKFKDFEKNNKIYIHLFFSTLYPWLIQRIEKSYLGDTIFFNQINKTFKLFDLINFLLFLKTGCYSNFWYRLFKIDPQFKDQISYNQANYEFMNRELIWTTAIDFLTFIIPIIDLQKTWTKLKNSSLKILKTDSFKLNELDNKIIRKVEDYKICAFCKEYPIDPHEIGCKHVFCYYCLQSNFELDQQYGITCFECKIRVNNKDCLKRINLRCLKNFE